MRPLQYPAMLAGDKKGFYFHMKLGPGEPLAAPWHMMPIDDFVGLLFDPEQRPKARPWIVAIDGRSAGGKSTLADLLQQSVPASATVHTDDVAWHHSFFDWGDLLIEGILKPLHGGHAVSYQPPGWQPHGRSGTIEIAAGLDLVIIEGVGAGRNEVMPWIDRLVWIQSDLAEAERRGFARDGYTEEDRSFWDEWMAQELVFQQQQRPWERATVIVNSTPTQPYDLTTQVIVSTTLLPKPLHTK